MADVNTTIPSNSLLNCELSRTHTHIYLPSIIAPVLSIRNSLSHPNHYSTHTAIITSSTPLSLCPLYHRYTNHPRITPQQQQPMLYVSPPITIPIRSIIDLHSTSRREVARDGGGAKREKERERKKGGEREEEKEKEEEIWVFEDLYVSCIRITRR